ncbi:MAG TPA: PAS domain-containing protein [Verrucomicrobiae bacterium]
MGEIIERTGLLRILLADEDDANAFLFQCGVNRLGRPCAFQRAAKGEQIAERLRSFQPNILIASGRFAQADELRKIKELSNGHPVICAVKSVEDGDAAMAAGAADCVLVSQVDELHACIERRLSGVTEPPYFKKDLVAKGKKAKKDSGPSKLDLQLEQFDRWVGRQLRILGNVAALKSKKLGRVSKMAWGVTRRAVEQQYKAAKVRWLLHKQKRLVQAKANLPAKIAETGVGARSGSLVELPRVAEVREELTSGATYFDAPVKLRPSEPVEAPKIRIVPKSSAEAVVAPKAVAEVGDSETLRTLELSFKTLFHTSLDPMFLLDGLGSFLHANAPACAMLGAAPADLLGKSLLDFVPMSDRPQVSAMWEALLIEGQQKAEMRLQGAGAEAREVYVSARSNLWFGVHLLIARDQTELRKLRAALSERQQAA